MPPADTRRVVRRRLALTRSASSRLCLHVLSSFQRTGCSSRRSPSAIFPSGEPSYLKEGLHGCQLLFSPSSISVNRLPAVAPHASNATSSPMFRALRCDLGVASLKEGFDSALSRVAGTEGHARSTQYTPQVRGCQPPSSRLQPSSTTTVRRANDYKQRGRTRQPCGKKNCGRARPIPEIKGPFALSRPPACRPEARIPPAPDPSRRRARPSGR